MLKRVIIVISVLIMTWGTICHAAEVLYENGGYKETLLTAKTVEEGKSYSIIKAKVKKDWPDNEYFVETWLIKTSTKQVVITHVERYDINGKLIASHSTERETKVKPDIVSKIIQYVDDKE